MENGKIKITKIIKKLKNLKKYYLYAKNLDNYFL